jgi:hypothetical protein
MENNFCIFILTHGRPDSVHTYNSLMKSGYTGKVFIVIDDEDKTEEEYRKRFGEKVLQFCKKEWAEKTDEGDNFNHRKAIVYARNACWQLAKQVGCRWFCQMDDDYTNFGFRYDEKLIYRYTHSKNINPIFDAVFEFLKVTGAHAIGISQGGDHIGIRTGEERPIRLKRKCMNSWFCDSEKPFLFFGHMNEDVSAYVTYGRQGKLIGTIEQVYLVQKPTQVTAGGMSELYLSAGTYVKSFYTVMAAPSCVQIGLMGDPRGKSARIHHKINWHNTAPKIIRQQLRKAR